LADAFYAAAHNADPGSEHQLAFMRGLLAYATESLHLDWIAGLLEGSEHLEGLKIDVDLRWGMLTRLTTTGYWDAARIEDELARDNTAFGAQSAAYARAAVPTAEAKTAAWKLLTESTDVANSVYQYTALGMRQPEQLPLLEPYVTRYFVDVEGVWRLHEHHMAEDFTLLQFPSLFVEEATVEMATNFLDTHPTGHVAMLRYVREGRANLLRAMRARQADM
jgi:aminopeptidase N